MQLLFFFSRSKIKMLLCKSYLQCVSLGSLDLQKAPCSKTNFYNFKSVILQPTVYNHNDENVHQ